MVKRVDTRESRDKRSLKEMLATLEDIRRRVEARGVDVGARMKELGLEDGYLFEDPWVEARPRRKRVMRSRLERSR